MKQFPFKKIGKIDFTGKKILIPTMHPYASRLLSACCRGFGADACAIPTYIDITVGKQFTSGKECFPCQVTISDVLNFLKTEKDRLKDKFKADNYVYFMPEADGPCRFGMYNKFQRIVLNSFEDFKDIYISYLTSEDAYSTKGIFPEEKATKVKKIAYLTVLCADVIDRITWRVRPYEKIKGATDNLVEEKIKLLENVFESRGEDLDFEEIYDILEKTAIESKNLISPEIKRKPKIGIIGEIYLRTHPPSNQFIISKIEEFGGEVVNASITEWINFVTYENIRKTKLFLQILMKEKLIKYIFPALKRLLSLKIEQEFQYITMKKAYKRVLKHLDVVPDHSVTELEKHLEHNRIYSYEVGTEAALSIAGALCYVKEGFNGVVNVFPFSCMPSTITSAILRPILRKMKVPYLDASFDGTVQPNRDIALKTFVFQAYQNMKKGS